MTAKSAIAGLALLLSLGSAGAETGAPDGKSPARKTDKPAKLMGKLDLNRDSRITFEEYAAGRQKRFARLDADANGALTRAEWLRRKARNPERAERRFAKLDGDRDGIVTAQEWVAAAERKFARSDRDADRALEPGELGKRARR